ncbi:MAG: pyruvate:ferredoxin (flavodoxin) oxidoreductase [Bacilli bacterium]|nr:pyruvate:ferredoxin (flavodoxin) oxidoreductase [Bacilli bacterium]
MKKIYKTIDGNEACALNSYLFTELASIYPITPSSTMAECVDRWSSEGKKNIFGDTVKVVEMQSEAGAAGMMHGSLSSGVLSTTYTASQGLLLMIPNMYKMAGELLPGVIHVAARSIATHALSILGDHQDVYATRMTGFALLSSSNVQEAHDLSLIAHLASLESEVPFLHFFDGFRTSHELQKIEIIGDADAKKLVNYEAIEKFRNKALNPNKPIIKGTAQNDDIYFQATEVRNKYYYNVSNIVENYMERLSTITGRRYMPFDYYGDKNATKIIVAMGSVCETIKETIDYLNKNGEKLGLIIVRLYRPFSSNHLLKVLPNSVKKIAVLDRTKEAGSIGEPLYLDVVSALKDKNIEILGGRYGLSSKNTSPKEIKAVFDFLDSKDRFNGFTVGINDDVSNLSINVDDTFKIDTNDISFLIYGYGSDGMISASKDILKIVGNNTKNYIQGYFQYDSKKSGGFTKSHLRFSNDKIRSTYYVDNPDLVVCSKESYIHKFDMLNNIKDGGIFLLNTASLESEINDILPDNVKKIIKDKNLRFYIINAHELARRNNLNNKISTVMESAIFKITNMLDYNFVKDEMKKSITEKYSKKSMEIVENNNNLIDITEDNIILIDNNTLDYKYMEVKENLDPFTIMNNQLGDKLSTSTFENRADGSFEVGTSKKEKRGASDTVPCWIKENCIECNQCSLVCPHAVIRPYILDDEEFDKLPIDMKENSLDMIGKDMSDYKFKLGISVLDCTGCGLCESVCPGKKGEKAIKMVSLQEELNKKTDKESEYLVNNIKEKDLLNPYTIRGSQFKKPKFEFSGACAGCGETAYIKLLTQLFGDRLIIANATGCSSIYGASAPSTPYSIPWANSLFEDNAEFGYGILMGNNIIRNRIKNIMENNLNNIDDYNNSLFVKWLENMNSYNITKNVYEKLDYNKLPKELVDLKEYIPYRSVWCLGGDGWAYDIGFSGIDHVLSTNDKAKILILDTEVYSNTGGQASKSSRVGAVAKFATSGKKTMKKDMVKIALSYPHVYVGTISLGANMAQAIKVMKEAEEYDGPAIIIAYAPCISHGIKGGMNNSLLESELAVECGYFPLIRYNPIDKKFILDYKEPNFELFEEFLNNETRYSMLKAVNKKSANELLKQNKLDAINRFNYYKELSEK